MFVHVQVGESDGVEETEECMYIQVERDDKIGETGECS